MFYAVAYQKRRTKDKDEWRVLQFGERDSRPSKAEIDKFVNDMAGWIFDEPRTWKGVLAVYDSDSHEMIDTIPLN